MEAAIRTVYEVVTGRELPMDGLHVAPIEGFTQIKTADLPLENVRPEFSFLEGFTVKVAVTSGLAGAKTLLSQVHDGTSPYHFIEVMGCPGGCIMGGGQPRSSDENVRDKRLRAILTEDESKTLRKSHENPYIKKLYTDFLGNPGSELSHELLHTTYVPRGTFNECLGK
jgi:NADP-reducing hydrogenase subunit HndD